MPPAEHPASSPSPASSGDLTHEMCIALWTRVIERLENGEVFTANRHFEVAIGEEYEELTGRQAAAPTRDYIQRMVEAVNALHPTTYLKQGVQNGVARAFEEGVRRLRWDVTKIQADGARAIKRFSRQESVRDLLQGANVRLDQTALLECVKDAVEAVERQQSAREAAFAARAVAASATAALMSPAPAAASEAAAAAAQAPPETPAVPETPAAFASDPEVQEALEAGQISQEEIGQRFEEAEQRRAELAKEEHGKVAKYLPRYVERKLLTDDEADKVKALLKVDEQLAKGEIDERQATRIRNSYMDGTSRAAVEHKLQEAVDGSVRYLQVFDAMQRIHPDYDEALAFLIGNKELVTAQEGDSVDPGATLNSLASNEKLLGRLIDIMDRKDQEIRLLAIRLPPYSKIMRAGLERIGNLTIEEGFVADLRNVTLDAMSERLNSPQKEARVRPAADMRCMINLVDHVIKRTRFRKELRMLKIAQTLEDFYRETSDPAEARQRAENFLAMRVRRLFPDLSVQESNELKQRSAELIDSIEAKVLERHPAAPSRGEGGKKQVFAADDLDELSPEEVERGIQIGRVELRVAGNARAVPLKIMPDPDDPERTVIATRDRATGELIPQLQRNLKRYVERGRDGTWRVTRS